MPLFLKNVLTFLAELVANTSSRVQVFKATATVVRLSAAVPVLPAQTRLE